MYLAELDLPEANAMRAQCEAPGMMALEIAIDEFAEKLGLDPIEFRIINHTQTVPDNPARPQSSKDPQAKIRKSTRVRPCRSRSASWSNAYGSARNASAGASAIPGLRKFARDVG
jgi:CO/xanthine dehydrogenase Mo-binding subunit